VGRHRNKDEPAPGKLYSLLDHRRADVAVSVGFLLTASPFGFIAVGIVVVMILLAWLV
jgi:hypothetical protein